MKKIRVLIVDDEPLARTRIQQLLLEEADVEIAGQCGNGRDAIAFIQENRPNLIFLDVQMPEVSGFDVLRALPADYLPVVIFVTAHDQHALQAFEVHALDYLLKPFKEARFREALQRARKQLEMHDTSALHASLQSLLAPSKTEAYPTRLAVRVGERTIFVRVEEIDYFEAAANYVVLHVGTQNHIVRETLSNMESRLSPRQFLRANRSALVNLERIKEVRPALRGEHVLLLKNGKEIPLTRGIREVRERLEFL